MEQRRTQRIRSIIEYHRLRNLPPPEHPLISVVDYGKLKRPADIGQVNWVHDFYMISMKRGMTGKIGYGQQTYDFDEGVMFFISPGQVFRIQPQLEIVSKQSGYMLLIHPDFFWGSSLAKKIKNYHFFDYSVNEALFLSKKEEDVAQGLVAGIQQEYHSNMDRFSQDIIISQLETLLNYCQRFYGRQFLTRKITNHRVLESLEELLDAYFDSDEHAVPGLPSVQFVANQLSLSVKYLSSLLVSLTGETTQQHIHDKLIQKAKQKLSGTSLSVSEIAYQLGFEHPQSFSKLFKAKTELSPMEFRASFN